MNHITLNNGVEMPILGFGVFQVGPEETEQAVSAAIAAGYRLIDSAEMYGNEAAVGAAIARSGVPREELFITTKVWVTDPGEENTVRKFDASLERLGLDYLDLYLIHQPFGDYYSEWRALESLARAGRTRAIGVSNFAADRFLDLCLNSAITPAINQVETNPFHQNTELQALIAAEGSTMQSWGPFAEGQNGFFANETLAAIGAAHGKSIAQVALRWMIQRGVVVIPKTVTPERMAQNIDVFDFELTDDDMAVIATLDTGTSQFFDHRNPDMVRMLSPMRFD